LIVESYIINYYRYCFFDVSDCAACRCSYNDKIHVCRSGSHGVDGLCHVTPHGIE
jgi:hypothetical protein